MKKVMIFAAFAALLSVASCQKEAVDKSVDSPVFTATIAGDTKTTINLNDGKIAWEDSDEITVKDTKSATAIYKIASIDQSTGRATFVIKDGQTALGDGPYSATYGSAPATTQTYSATAGKLHMTAPATETNSFTFTVACGLMKLNLTKAVESVKSVAVTGTPNGGSKTTYTLNCASAESIASAKDFFIALPAGSYTKIVITNSSDKVCTLDAKSPVVVTNNHIKPVTIEESKITFQAMSGIFCVSSTKKVRFSKGNLQAKYNGSNYTWDFAANQYDYIGNAAGNTTIGGSQQNGKVVDLFGWSTASTNYGINTSTTDTHYSGNFNDWGKNIGDGNTWRTLSKDEWVYLFNNRRVNGGTGVGKSYSRDITYGGKKGLVLYPDNYTGSPLSGTVTTIPDGVVFLPAAGYRKGSVVNYVGTNGRYWSSTASGKYNANLVSYASSELKPDAYVSRDYGYSVRLVTDAN